MTVMISMQIEGENKREKGKKAYINNLNKHVHYKVICRLIETTENALPR